MMIVLDIREGFLHMHLVVVIDQCDGARDGQRPVVGGFVVVVG